MTTCIVSQRCETIHVVIINEEKLEKWQNSSVLCHILVIYKSFYYSKPSIKIISLAQKIGSTTCSPATTPLLGSLI